MRVLLPASEAVPYAKTGGLADVAGALLRELRALGVDARLFMPLYGCISAEVQDTGKSIPVQVGKEQQEGRLYTEGPYVFIRCDKYFARRELYGTPEGDYPDNAHRFVFLSRAVLEAAKALQFRPHIVHANDWQTALVPFYLKTLYRGDAFFKDVKTLFTIHNLGYQGLFPRQMMLLTGLGWEYFNPEALEFYGRVNFLKAGILGADMVSTVSPSYAREILTPEYGFGLEGLLQKRAERLRGILNGLDTGTWNPLHDEHLPSPYGVRSLAGKGRAKALLVKRCGFSQARAPLLAMVGRLSAQKGVDLLLEVAPWLISQGANLVVLGKGDGTYQEALAALASRSNGKLYLRLELDEAFAHLVYAGADMFLMPSRYEPCGLGQMIAQLYGTPPVARSTGGIADTVEDYVPLRQRGTGFLFKMPLAECLKEAIRSALCLWPIRDKWQRLQRAGMQKDFSWRRSARQYLSLYKELLGK